ncbi:sugar ABC transporter ATP-binding protein [Prauserella marina]|uniref:Ribose transport system ATP-binding protein n=1 Tax=Prauserella marina TaxID=530584 RepID=A0A222VLZ7_9PSEU|nr:sugar ABC transporter ATP-binding protein [Prauserella marina]ASR34960.1 sugar ABC transporter ATP-binding protein [Prauserella marina]PWV85319.1 ribose transport system ATP-binding protein [Prauserella marina]SDC57604.1 ribose transport system ATP-binding protein [Prauserella marina]
MRGIVKLFPGVRALDGVDLDVRAGEVHCLLGQNGAGKSTLIKTLAGAHQPDAGDIVWQGRSVSLSSPVAALKRGIATMYQELDLIPTLSVAENIFLGHEHSRFGFTRPAATRARAAALLDRLGHAEISADTEVGKLSAAGQQLVSMARALAHDAKLIVADEPTAALASDEVDNLFRIIGELTDEGVAVVYISHRLEEIRRIGHRVTVIKDGRTVAANLDAAGSPTSDLVDLMAGRKVQTAFREAGEAKVEFGDVVLDVQGLGRRDEFSDVTFSVRAGEIVGLAGLVGAGRSEVLETVFGARKADAGTVTVGGKTLRAGSVSSAVKAGVGLAPEERKSQGLLLDMSVTHNVTLASLGEYSTAGFSQRGREVRDSRSTLERLDLRPADPRRIVRTLSGGNQQKAVVARWLVHGCKVLLLDEPTRGVDVGARAELYRLIHELAESGVAIVLVSSEIPEVLGLSDRVLVLRDGKVLADRRASELSEAGVLDMVMEGSAA